ncbi:MAG: glycosidase-like protein, partial [Pseudomonadota bacterium]|nr:glycosidase-like protein [Pseudomonadota bacterium]
MLTGANLIEDPAAPFGSSKARESFRLLAEAGANMVALIPFFWQAHAADPNLVRGSALPRDRLRRGVRDAVDAGLQVLVKPHVWVPER